MFESCRNVVHVDNALDSVKAVKSLEVLLADLGSIPSGNEFPVPDSKELLERAKLYLDE